MLCLIGEAFEEDSTVVNGAVVSVRTKGDKIGMWLGDSSKGDAILTIGKKVKERLGIEQRVSYPQVTMFHLWQVLKLHLPTRYCVFILFE